MLVKGILVSGSLNSVGQIAYWFISAALISIAIFFISVFSLSSYIINGHGEDKNLWFLSLVIYTTVIFVG